VGLHYRADKLIAGRPSLSTQGEKLPQNEGINQATSKRLAEKYRVSKSTVERAAKISEGIDAIAQVSTTARKKIIAGDVRISRKRLSELAAAPKKELTEVARSIEDGSYAAREPATATSGSGSSVGSGPRDKTALASDTKPVTLQELKAQIDEIRGIFDRELKSLATQSDTLLAAKPALQGYLTRLEDLLKGA